MAKSQDIEERVADILVDKKIVTFSFDPPYVYTTGLKSPIYIDNRLLISYPKERTFIVTELINLIKSKKELRDVEFIASTLNYAAPFGILIANALDLPIILVKSEPSSHGKKSRIEGHLPKKKKVLIIEDHLSTGVSLVSTATVIRENGGIVTEAIAITNYEFGIAKDALKKARINVSVLTKGSLIVAEAVKRGLLKKSEQKQVLEWLKNPVQWGEERGYYSNFD